MSKYRDEMSEGEAYARDDAFMKALHMLPVNSLVRMFVVGEEHHTATKTYVIQQMRGSTTHFYWHKGTWRPCVEGVAFADIEPAWTSDE